MDSVKLYDTTLRDGTQSEDISFTVEDKIRISRKLDELGIDYIEGGWPGSNPRDMSFFSEIKNYSMSQAKIVAFSSTARPFRAPLVRPGFFRRFRFCPPSVRRAGSVNPGGPVPLLQEGFDEIDGLIGVLLQGEMVQAVDQVVQQFVDRAGDHGFHLSLGQGFDPPLGPEELFQFRLADPVEFFPELSHQGPDVPQAEPVHETADVVFDDFPSGGEVFRPRLEVLPGYLVQVVHAVEVNVFELVDSRVEIARYRDVDYQQGAAAEALSLIHI